MMTDTVSEHLRDLKSVVQDNHTLSLVLVLHTTNSQVTFDKTINLLHTVATREGFDNFAEVGKSCGRELCVKFIEKVEEYYEETIQHQYNAGPFRQSTATPQQG
jgi:hypothetical protein